MAAGLPTLLWITNLAPPYRRALWRELGQDLDLHVGLLARTEPNRHWDSVTPDPGYRLFQLPSRPLGPRGLLRHLYLLTTSARSLLLSVRPDVVIISSYESPAYQSILRAAKIEGIPVILWYASHPNSHRFRHAVAPWLRRRTLNLTTVVLATGKLAHESALRQVNAKEKVLACHHTVDIDSIREAVDLARCQQPTYGRPGHRFLYVGQIIRRKNVLALVDAFRRVARPADELLLVGDGPQTGKVRKAAKDVDVGRVELVGHRSGDALWKLFAESHTLVLSSTNEVFGLVALEGLAADLNVVVARTAGAAADMSGRPNVYSCEPSVDGLAGALEASRSDWRGPRRTPMEQFSIQQMRAAVVTACIKAIQTAGHQSAERGRA